MVGKFPNRTGPMIELLKAETPPLGWTNYCAMNVTNQAIWEERGDASTKAILLLLNSKNNNAKRDLHLSYSQGNKSAYRNHSQSNSEISVDTISQQNHRTSMR